MGNLDEKKSTVEVERNVKRDYIVFAVICLGYLFALVPRFGLAINSDQISETFGLTAGGLGVLAAVYFYPYALMQIPGGFLSDMILPEKLVAVSLLLISIGNFGFATTSIYPIAVVSRALTGLGGSLIYVPALRYIATYFPTNKFSTLGAILMSINGLASILVNGPLALISETYSWRSSFLISAVATLLFGASLKVLAKSNPVKSSKRGKFSDRIKELGKMSKIVVKNKNAWPLFFRSFVTYGVIISFQSLWSGPYMMTFLGINRITAGRILVLMSVGMLIGGPLGGYLSDSVFKNRRKMSLTSILLGGVFWIPFIVMGKGMTPMILTITLISMGFCSSLGGSVATAQVKEVFPIDVAGTGMGFNNFFLTGSGALMPMFFGFMMGIEGANPYRNMVLVNLFMIILAAMATYISVETYKKSEEEI